MAEDKIFPAALAIGLLLLAALLVIFNSSIYATPAVTSTTGLFGWLGQSDQPELILAELPGSRLIGNEISTSTSSVNLGAIDISGVSAVARFDGGRVQNGVLFGDRDLRYSVTDAECVSFRVTGENGYGPLIVKINGKAVFNKKTGISDMSIPIEGKGNTTIEIEAGSSGWRIWAPALYDIANVSISSANKEKSFAFSPGKDVASALLKLSGVAAGQATISMNGQTVWSGDAKPENIEIISISPQPTATDIQTMTSQGWRFVGSRKEGNMYYHQWHREVGNADSPTYFELRSFLKEQNNLKIIAGANSTISGSAELKIVYLTTTEHKFETILNLTGNQYDKLPGHITFDVINAISPGGIVVKLVQGNQTKLAERLDAIPGSVAVPIFPANYIKGEAAKLVIEGTDNGLFYVRNVKVWV